MGSHEEIIMELFISFSIQVCFKIAEYFNIWTLLIKKYLNTNQNSQKLLITQVPRGKYSNSYNLYTSSFIFFV